MPRAQRNKPLWQQISEYYKKEILSGALREGDLLPSVRAIAAEWVVAPTVAQQAIAHLHLAEHLVRTDPSGTYVDKPRAALSPQQRMRLEVAPASEVVTVTAAGLTDAPDYIVTTVGLPERRGAAVIRREEVTALADGSPHMLAVTWVSPRWLSQVPELLHQVPLPDPKGAAHLIAARAGIDPATLTGGVVFECRLAKNDGRELPALGLEPGAYVLAGVSGWRNGEDVLAYTEFILPPGQVVEADIEP